MKILTVCSWGQNRSRYLAEHLQKKGYEVQFAGVNDQTDNRVSQEQIDWADVIVFVTPMIQKGFEQHFSALNKKIITLNTEDRMSVLAPGKENISAEKWQRIQEEKVYPSLEEQIEKYLPLK